MNKEETSQTLAGSNKDMYNSINKNKCDTQRKQKISVRLKPDLLKEIEKTSDNRSKAIRKALRRQLEVKQ